MLHLILFYYILSLSLGTASLVFSFFAYFKYRNEISKVYLIFQILLFLFVLNHMIYFYFVRFLLVKTNFISFMNINYICLLGMLIFFVSKLTYLFVGKTLPHIFRNMLFLLSLSSFLSVIFILLFKIPVTLQEGFICFYGIVLIGNILYTVILLLQHLSISSNFIRELDRNIIIILVFFLPGFLIDLNFDLFQNRLKVIPKVFNFVALFYIFWNIFTIYYAYKFLVRLYEKIDVFDLPEDFFKRYSITGREKDIAILLLQGHTNKEIADRLYLSEGTVKNYIYNLFQKLDIKSRMHFIKKIIEYLKGRDGK